MMGRLNGGRVCRFSYVHPEDFAPGDHLLRRADAVLDLSWPRGDLAAYYSHTGRPAIDPELMMRMLILSYVFASRSKR